MFLLLAPHATTTTTTPPDAKAACAVLNFSQKVDLMHGFGEIAGYSRNSGCGGFCGRQTFRWDNGPQGFGDHSPAGNSTQWPSTLNIAATFDPKLARAFGTAMGEEWWGKGTNFLEGPGINVMRVPYNGRTFEYISGEDPVLGSMLVGPAIDGMQLNAMAIAKHYILNNQETDRSGVDELVDEKVIMELYAPPFETASHHNVAGYMCAYNRINGVWACEQPETLKTMLKGYFNFSGFVVSDWGACHSTVDALNAGLDIEMPGDKFFNRQALQAALDNQTITMARIDESCVRILSRWYAMPASKRYPCATPGGSAVCIGKNVSTADHKALARKLAAESTVLLKNAPLKGGRGQPLLPLRRPSSQPLRIALIGPDAEKPYTAGGGSGHVADSNVAVSPLMAFRARSGVSVDYVSGCKPDGSADIDGAAAAAAKADVALVFVSATTGEGFDRKDLNLSHVLCGGASYPQEALIVAVAAQQPKTVVSMAAPGPMLTPWRTEVGALLCAFLPGEQYGNAIAGLIFGDTVPQAKLPVTMPNTANDQGMGEHQWPGVPSKRFPAHKEVRYSEGLINGYRWYDKHNVAPAYPFGFGLTYGPPYTYSGLRITGRTIAFTVSRGAAAEGSSDDVVGCDTPQVYISYPGSDTDAAMPSKVLRYFQKVCDASADLTYTLTDRDVSQWDVSQKAWVVTKGTFAVYVAQASQGDGASLSGVITI